jgi:formylglycine-generating enzyme required for sulfatase activity
LCVEEFYIFLRLHLFAPAVNARACRHAERCRHSSAALGMTAGNGGMAVRTCKMQFLFYLTQKSKNKMKKILISLFSLLLFAASVATATAQGAKPKLAVLVVGMDDWMIGDVLAHLVGEELNRGDTYEVVTRESYVQNKLESLRRGTDRLDEYLLRAWATEQGISNLCFVTPMSGFSFSLRLLDVLSGEVLCSGSSMDPNAVALKQLAWSLAGSIGSSCTSFGSWTPFGYLGSYTEPSIGLEMVYVEAGRFTMGCVSGRDDLGGGCYSSEQPSHSARVGSFWMGKYEVTQAQWEAVMGTTVEQQRNKLGSASDFPLYGVGANYPMYYVSWDEAQAFCDTLSARTRRYYWLPTESEWEYAARGGKLSRGYLYSGSNDIDSVAWHHSNSGDNGGSTNRKVHAVGTTKKRGNELGICDMSGNAYEWCSDYWRSDYSGSASISSNRVVRGSSWEHGAWDCRVVSRLGINPNSRGHDMGFRVV